VGFGDADGEPVAADEGPAEERTNALTPWTAAEGVGVAATGWLLATSRMCSSLVSALPLVVASTPTARTSPVVSASAAALRRLRRVARRRSVRLSGSLVPMQCSSARWPHRRLLLGRSRQCPSPMVVAAAEKAVGGP
jgi:hypothetical protein